MQRSSGDIESMLTLEWRGFRATLSDLKKAGWEIDVWGSTVYIRTDCWEDLCGEIGAGYHVALKEVTEFHAFKETAAEIPRLLSFIIRIQEKFCDRPTLKPSKNVIPMERIINAKR